MKDAESAPETSCLSGISYIVDCVQGNIFLIMNQQSPRKLRESREFVHHYMVLQERIFAGNFWFSLNIGHFCACCFGLYFFVLSFVYFHALRQNWQNNTNPKSLVLYHKMELHVSRIIWTAIHPDMQKIRTVGFFFENELHWQFEVERKFSANGYCKTTYLFTYK